MKFIVLVAGGLLVAGGGISIWNGVDIIMVERGWTQVIAGAVAVSGGVVTLAIGALIASVQKLHATVEAAGEDFLRLLRLDPPAASVGEQPEPAPAPAAPAAPPEPAPPKEKIAAPRPDASTLPAAGAKAIPNVTRPADIDFDSLPPATSAVESPEPPVPAPPPPPEPPRPEPPVRPGRDRLPSVDDVGPALDWLRSGPAKPRSSAIDAAETPAGDGTGSAPVAPAATTLRRFESGGVNYTLFADGSILAESPGGSVKFPDMDALRRHLASRGPTT